ncbi:helix-turn-helix domain-containing protein [Siphonobacter aquaeclarae]|uniref:Helix-turn-helix domain-containing protein n=1 Tax=Siphonobacter aquaeclarae TaxID=563176 RepID=A0A1G9SWI3_9BACT|nr:helix-turn-helix transcriptional regulator [Siphonobacter aquaeclarae]SDM39205.1 Helix-turn-helix domain-containing protein [Siphonobacter aquaeclarae]
MSEKRVHEGRNVKRFREMLGIKQEALAAELGSDWNQKKISLLEARQAIDEDILHDVAKVLKVPTEAIKNFDEEQAINVISNTFHENAFIGVSGGTYHINPVEKWMEALEEIKRLNAALLEEKERYIALLRDMNNVRN